MISTSPEFINHVYTTMVRPVRYRGHLGGRISPNGALVHPRAPARSVTSLRLDETCRNHSPASITSHGALHYTHGEGSGHSTAASGLRHACMGLVPGAPIRWNHKSIVTFRGCDSLVTVNPGAYRATDVEFIVVLVP